MDWIEQKRLGRDPKDDRWGAVGAGWVLVLLPSLALFFGAAYLEKHESIGLPVVAVFGIMVLVGALAMTSTLFRRLRLTSRNQPLALPPGSVRATMALALIVLFSIIAIAAMRPPQELKHLNGVSGTMRAEFLRDPRFTVVQSALEGCASTKGAPAQEDDSVIALAPPRAAPNTACAAADERYSIVVKVGPDAGSQDLIKQLVLMIGQLMTMAVSFYFAGRNAGAADDGADSSTDSKKRPDPTPAPGPDGGNVPAPTPTDGTPSAPATENTPSAPPVDPASTQTPLSVPLRAATGPGLRSGTTFDVDTETHTTNHGYYEHEGCGEAGDRHTVDKDLPEAQGGIARP